jgi:NADPH:quinone reductase-like Zn-dependent oxidoreductase
MKAIEFTETGGPEVMYLREIPMPTPQQDEELIRVAVTGVNFIDLYLREGGYGATYPSQYQSESTTVHFADDHSETVLGTPTAVATVLVRSGIS